jgi:hypothetical protein
VRVQKIRSHREEVVRKPLGKIKGVAGEISRRYMAARRRAKLPVQLGMRKVIYICAREKGANSASWRDILELKRKEQPRARDNGVSERAL